VHHPVGLVHNDVSTLGQHDNVPFNYILQPTRSSNDDFGAFP
jgi:hypothetical protein